VPPQFVGIVLEVKPTFVSGRRPRGHIVQDHFDPTMVALGSFSGNAHRIVQRYPQRGYRINVVASFDTEAARATCTKRLATSIRALLA
jgi:hypothetical protein